MRKLKICLGRRLSGPLEEPVGKLRMTFRISFSNTYKAVVRDGSVKRRLSAAALGWRSDNLWNTSSVLLTDLSSPQSSLMTAVKSSILEATKFKNDVEFWSLFPLFFLLCGVDLQKATKW